MASPRCHHGPARPISTWPNRLHRVRNELSTPALLHLAPHLCGHESSPKRAQELLKDRGRQETWTTTRPRDDWPVADLRALYALALQEVSPASEEAGKQVAWLLGPTARAGRWSPDSATGPARHGPRSVGSAQTSFETERYHLDVFVGKDEGRRPGCRAGFALADDRRFRQRSSPRGGRKIRFQMTGRGPATPTSACSPALFPPKKLRSTTGAWIARRVYEPAPLEVDGPRDRAGIPNHAGQRQAISKTRSPSCRSGRRAIVLLGTPTPE